MSAFSEMIGGVLNSGAVKGVGLALALSTVGFVGNQQLHQGKVDAQIEDHSKQLVTLQTTADRQTKAGQDLAIAVARVEGKLDVLGQKIDDDRYEQRHPQPPQTATSPGPPYHWVLEPPAHAR